MQTGTPASHQSARAFSFDRGQFINGRCRDGSARRSVKGTDPYSCDLLAEFVLADASDVDEAYKSAHQAQANWAGQLPEQRSDVLRHACEVMEAHRDEIIPWIIRESGSTRIKASLEWSAVYGVLRDAATMPYRLEGRILPVDVPGKESRVYRKPVGVVGVISPWNWPFQLSSRSVFPALAVGNSVVLKPASDTPVTGGLLLAAILEEAGLRKIGAEHQQRV